MQSCNLAEYRAINDFVGRTKVSIHHTTSITQSDNPSINGHIHLWEGGGLNIDETSNLVVGKYGSIALGVEFFLGGNHRTDFIATALLDKSRPDRIASKGDISIGNDVWIGYKALILSGTSIGDGAVIGAKAVVSGKIPPYAIVVGNPGRVVKYRFEPEIIDLLLRVRWWDWPEELIEQRKDLLLSGDFEQLRALYPE